MKDLYTFDASLQEAENTYLDVRKAYQEIFTKIGVEFKEVEASSGAMGGTKSHEYHYLSSEGEDLIIACEHQNRNVEVAEECGCSAQKAIEVGHAFVLGQRYSQVLGGASFMGCFGVGISRLIAAIATTSSDNHGLIWPKNVAPFPVTVVGLESGAEAIAQKIVEKTGYDILLDDRRSSHSIGWMLADAYLLGSPWVVVIGQKGLELINRQSQKAQLLLLDECINAIAN